MPTYDYTCQSCGHAFEAFQSMKDAPLTDCPECHGLVKRGFGGGTGVIFRGSGFYINDSKKTETKPAEVKNAVPAPVAAT